MDFFFFILVNFTLFVRPGELVPAIAEVPIYNYLILSALVVSAPRIAQHLQPAQLAREPITACVLGLVPAIVLSHLSHFDTWSARYNAFEFSKTVAYYLLLISVVDSVRRLKAFLYAIALFAALTSTIAVLQYFEYINIPSLTMLYEGGDADDVTGGESAGVRLRATGLFGDPNDLSMIAVLALVVSLFALCDKRLRFFRYLWLAPTALLGTALVLTKSRGGMLAFGTAAAVLSCSRFGYWKTAVAGSVVVPVLAVLIGGRQTDLGGALSGGTGASRVELWSEGLALMKHAPLFGIGCHQYDAEVRHVAHNSFVHCFVELGLFGGALFLGAFWFSGLSLWKVHRLSSVAIGPLTSVEFRAMRPFLAAILGAYCTSMLSLSRSYVPPTYMVLGIANAYCLQGRQFGMWPLVTLTPRRLVQLVQVSVLFLVLTYVFIRITVR